MTKPLTRIVIMFLMLAGAGCHGTYTQPVYYPPDNGYPSAYQAYMDAYRLNLERRRQQDQFNTQPNIPLSTCLAISPAKIYGCP
jgi:hypothetical protein